MQSICTVCKAICVCPQAIACVIFKVVYANMRLADNAVSELMCSHVTLIEQPELPNRTGS
jgi:hypothetical protein